VLTARRRAGGGCGPGPTAPDGGRRTPGSATPAPPAEQPLRESKADVGVRTSAHADPTPFGDPGLEGDVVVRAAAGADRRALEVRGVGRHVGARLEGAVPAATARVVRARAEELDAVGH